MDAIRRYRAVAVEVTCRNDVEPLHWESHTTMTDTELLWRARRWSLDVWGAEHEECAVLHAVSITEIPEVSTGSRRG